MANTLKFGNGQWATKVGSTLAYNDENGNFKPLPFNFTRSTSATRVNKEGLIEVVTNNKPRIDFLNDSNGSLLLEPQRSNLALYSEDFSNGVYDNTNGTVTTNNAISPDGTQNADTWTATSGSAILQGVVTITSGIQYTMSIYLKRKTGTGQVALRGVSNTSTNITITDEWQRYSVTLTSTDTNGRYGVFLLNSGDEVYIWGAQLELGSYATSYIPTQGAISTRVAEICSIDNLDDYVSSKTSWTATGEFVKGQDKGNSLYIFFAYYLESSNLFRIRDYINSVRFYLFEPSEQSWGFTANLGQNIKWSIRAKSDGTYSIYVNGALLIETSGTFRKLDSYAMYGNAKTSVNNLRVYNTALTDQELINLTTI